MWLFLHKGWWLVVLQLSGLQDREDKHCWLERK